MIRLPTTAIADVWPDTYTGGFFSFWTFLFLVFCDVYTTLFVCCYCTENRTPYYTTTATIRSNMNVLFSEQ